MTLVLWPLLKEWNAIGVQYNLGLKIDELKEFCKKYESKFVFDFTLMENDDLWFLNVQTNEQIKNEKILFRNDRFLETINEFWDRTTILKKKLKDFKF